MLRHSLIPPNRLNQKISRPGSYVSGGLSGIKIVVTIHNYLKFKIFNKSHLLEKVGVIPVLYLPDQYS